MSYCMYNCDPAPDEEYCDIYLYGDVERDAIVCFDCCMNGGKDAMFEKRSDVIKHMEEHKAKGHKAPYDFVFWRLRKEIDVEGDVVDFNSDDQWTGDASPLQSVKECIDLFRGMRMKRYEIVNPSDLCFIKGDDFKTVCIATTLLGEGYYGLQEVDGESTMPIHVFAQGWFEDRFGECFADALDVVDREKLKIVLSTVSLGGERASLNDIERHAKSLVERL